MSYVLTLGAAVTAKANYRQTLEVTVQKLQDQKTDLENQIKDEGKKQLDEIADCSKLEFTGEKYIDDTLVKCCEEVKRKWGLSAEQQAEGVVQCVARGVGAAACMAAGAAVGGPVGAAAGALVAPLCGEVAAFLADRVMGYDALQLGAGITAAAICGTFSGGTLAVVCGFAAAELVGWISDAVGPLIEGIFDPGAAARREKAARDAYHRAIEANERACLEADDRYRLAWGLGVHELKELYRQAFPTPALQAKAKAQLGYGFTYDEIARAMVKAGAASHPSNRPQNKGKRGCYGEHPDWECPGCEDYEYARTEKPNPKAKALAPVPGASASDTLFRNVVAAWTVEGKKDPWSDICPFSVTRFYLQQREKALGPNPKRDQITAWEKKFKPVIESMAATIYPAMVSAIATVGTAITSARMAIKAEELLLAAQSASREQLAARVAVAAARAEAAADVARHGWGRETHAAIVRAGQQYDIAVGAYRRLQYEQLFAAPGVPLTPCGDPCRRAGASLARAKAAKENAPLFAARAARNRLLLGAAVAAGGIGAAYYFTR